MLAKALVKADKLLSTHYKDSTLTLQQLHHACLDTADSRLPIVFFRVQEASTLFTVRSSEPINTPPRFDETAPGFSNLHHCYPLHIPGYNYNHNSAQELHFLPPAAGSRIVDAVLQDHSF